MFAFTSTQYFTVSYSIIQILLPTRVYKNHQLALTSAVEQTFSISNPR